MHRVLLGFAFLAASAAAVLIAVRRLETDARAPLRAALLTASIVVAALIVVGVEILSAFDSLSAVPLACFWGVVFAAALTVAGASLRQVSSDLASAAATIRAMSALDLAMVVALVAFAATTFVTAVIAPPNNWDSMSYHMPRVAHWLANRSVRPYASVHIQQLFMPPFSSYVVATLQALAGGDRWANVVQWAAYVAGASAVSLATARVGGGVRAQLASGLAFLTLPMAVAEAATTQTDLVTTYWYVALVAVILAPYGVATVLRAGAVVGLGMLTKPTFEFYAVPAVGLLLWRARGPRPHAGTTLRNATVAALAIGVIATTAIVPHALRIAPIFALEHGGAEALRTPNATWGLRPLLSNVVRDLALHLPLPGYGSGVMRLHAWLGIDPNDPRTTHLFDCSFSQIAERWYRPLIPNEDTVGAPAHLLTALLFLGIALGRRGAWTRWRTAVLIVAAATLGWLAFAAVFKWQPWSARFDLPFFAALCVPLGLGLARLRPRSGATLAAFWIVGGLPALLVAVHRPLVSLAWVPYVSDHLADDGPPRVTSVLFAPPDDVLFAANRNLERPYLAAVDRVRASGCETVGLELARDGWEYPLWRLLGVAAGQRPGYLAAVAVQNESAVLDAYDVEPCLVVSAVRDSAFAGQPEWTAEPISEQPFLRIYRRNTGRAPATVAHDAPPRTR